VSNGNGAATTKFDTEANGATRIVTNGNMHFQVIDQVPPPPLTTMDQQKMQKREASFGASSEIETIPASSSLSVLRSKRPNLREQPFKLCMELELWMVWGFSINYFPIFLWRFVSKINKKF
jgi:hypothetical protein